MQAHVYSLQLFCTWYQRDNYALRASCAIRFRCFVACDTQVLRAILRAKEILREETQLGEEGDGHSLEPVCGFAIRLGGVVGQGIDFEEHESSIMDNALGCEEGRGNGYAAEGLDRVEVELCDGISLRSLNLVVECSIWSILP